MSLQIKIIVVVAVLIFLTRSSCKKRWFDNRNKYIGEWQMRMTSDDWVLGRTPMPIFDTVDYVAKVYYNVRPGANGTLDIRKTDGNNMHVRLTDTGKIEACKLAVTVSESTVNIVLDNSNTCTFGMGSGANYTYTGTHIRK